MPALKNRRWELFCLELFRGLADKGISNTEAYVRAGFTRNRNSAKVQACRLLQNCPAVIARVKELQAEAAKERKVSVESIADRLDIASKIAEEDRNPQGITGAETAKAKLYGLQVDKQEIRQVGDVSQAQSTAEIVEQVLRDLGASDPTEAMRHECRAELQRHSQALKAIALSQPASLTEPNQPTQH
jgi:phage terminase small subunit